MPHSEPALRCLPRPFVSYYTAARFTRDPADDRSLTLRFNAMTTHTFLPAISTHGIYNCLTVRHTTLS